MSDVPRSSPKENLRASQSNTYLSPGSLFNPRHKRNRSIFYADEILARHNRRGPRTRFPGVVVTDSVSEPVFGKDLIAAIKL